MVMLTIGTIYSWALFTQPLLVAYGWDLTTTTWAYAIANFALAAVGAVIGGFWQDSAGPRTVAMVGVTLWACGNIIIFNALGRCLWGAISDRIGCSCTFAAMFSIQAITVLLFAHMHDLMPALAAVSVILTAWGFAGLIGPIIVARTKDLTGSFAGLLPLIAVVLTMSVVLPFLTKKPSRTGRVVNTRHPVRAVGRPSGISQFELFTPGGQNITQPIEQ